MELKILCIGNSFSVDTTWHIWRLAQEMGVPKLHFGNLYVGGCSIRQHHHHLENDLPVYRFYESRGEEWTAEEEWTIARAVELDDWDWISIQHGTKDGSRYSKAESYEKLPELVEKVKALASPHTKTAFNMTWVGEGEKPKSEMPEYAGRLDVLYRDIADLTRERIVPMPGIDKVCPTGTAIENFRRRYDGPLTRDEYHLNREFGRYIAGLAFLKALTGLPTEGLSWLPEDMTEQQRRLAVEAVESAMEQPFRAWE